MKVVDSNGVAIEVEGRPKITKHQVADAIDASIILLRSDGWRWWAIGLYHGMSISNARYRFKNASDRAKAIATERAFAKGPEGPRALLSSKAFP